jgi:hypothetical protein
VRGHQCPVPCSTATSVPAHQIGRPHTPVCLSRPSDRLPGGAVDALPADTWRERWACPQHPRSRTQARIATTETQRVVRERRNRRRIESAAVRPSVSASTAGHAPLAHWRAPQDRRVVWLAACRRPPAGGDCSPGSSRRTGSTRAPPPPAAHNFASPAGVVPGIWQPHFRSASHHFRWSDGLPRVFRSSFGAQMAGGFLAHTPFTSPNRKEVTGSRRNRTGRADRLGAADAGGNATAGTGPGPARARQARGSGRRNGPPGEHDEVVQCLHRQPRLREHRDAVAAGPTRSNVGPTRHPT